MTLYVRQQVYEVDTNIITQEIHRSSDMVSRYTGMVIQPNKAIVGANAFAHEAGIHQDGMLKNKRTYEIMDADTIGLSHSKLVLGKHSGRHALSECASKRWAIAWMMKNSTKSSIVSRRWPTRRRRSGCRHRGVGGRRGL